MCRNVTSTWKTSRSWQMWTWHVTNPREKKLFCVKIDSPLWHLKLNKVHRGSSQLVFINLVNYLRLWGGPSQSTLGKGPGGCNPSMKEIQNVSRCMCTKQSPTFSFKFVPIPRPYPSTLTYAHPCPPIVWYVPTHAHPCYSNCAHVFKNYVMCITCVHQVRVRSYK